ncbi:MAG: CDP-alcohol phosphatidyltransferase family protein, partial [Planctomycetes bacterium]|nr:CDP-alcohol phosphatidyltransferase family protein [Planctomycetota bacterium]
GRDERQSESNVDENTDRKESIGVLRWLNRSREFRLSWPTRITLVRILLIIPFVDCMLSMHDPSVTKGGQEFLRHVAIVLFFVMAISDAVDGYWARHRKQITKLGAFLDPLADKLLITCASLLLVSERGHVDGFLLPMTVVVLIIGKDVLITIGFLVMYLITSRVHIVPVLAGKLATALQLTMVTAVLIGPDLVEVIPGYRELVHVLWWSAAAAAVVATVVYIRNGSRYIEDYERTQGQRPGTPGA